MSKTAAHQQAVRESSMYRQGSGWIVSTWSDHARCHIVTGELSYHNARTWLTYYREQRAEQLAA